MLVHGLPPDAAVRREGKAWTQHDELLAQLIERSDVWGRWLAVGQGRKARDVPTMPPIKHPDRGTETGSAQTARTRDVRRLTVAEFEAQYLTERR